MSLNNQHTSDEMHKINSMTRRLQGENYQELRSMMPTHPAYLRSVGAPEYNEIVADKEQAFVDAYLSLMLSTNPAYADQFAIDTSNLFNPTKQSEHA